MIVRVIAQELERIGVHLGDLSALAGDIAYATGNAAFGALRTKAINTTLALCGSRFGRGLIAVGRRPLRPLRGAAGRDPVRRRRDRVGRGPGRRGAVRIGLGPGPVREGRGSSSRKPPAGSAWWGRRPGPAAWPGTCVRTIPTADMRSFPVHKMTLDSGDVFARAYLRSRRNRAIRPHHPRTAGGPGREEICCAPPAAPARLGPWSSPWPKAGGEKSPTPRSRTRRGG